MKRILFVDDEPNVLQGLKRMLHAYRQDWEMVFVNGGEEALRELSEGHFDVLVTDIRMPHMTGIQLLEKVIQSHPEIVRIVLSGMADKEVTLPSVMLAHQYLAKPCDAAILRATVDRALNLRVMLVNPELKHLISRIHSLPSVPVIYTELMRVLQSPEVSAKEIGSIIRQDLAMTAKVLQLVNSAFFGVRRQITDPTEAVIYLGADTVKALALTISVFSQFDTKSLPGFSVESLRDHSLTVATLARQIAKSLPLSNQDIENVFLGGLMHELGKLVLACNYPQQYEKVIRAAQTGKIPACQAELEIFGATHAEIGAYLLWLWGLPDAITEIVARYQHPSPDSNVGPVVAVHVADALFNHDPERDIDRECLAALGLIDRLPFWKQLHDQVLTEVPAC